MAFTLGGELWPTEVQREVSPGVVARWGKSLELCAGSRWCSTTRRRGGNSR